MPVPPRQLRQPRSAPHHEGSTLAANPRGRTLLELRYLDAAMRVRLSGIVLVVVVAIPIVLSVFNPELFEGVGRYGFVLGIVFALGILGIIVTFPRQFMVYEQGIDPGFSLIDVRVRGRPDFIPWEKVRTIEPVLHREPWEGGAPRMLAIRVISTDGRTWERVLDQGVRDSAPEQDQHMLERLRGLSRTLGRTWTERWSQLGVLGGDRGI
jgi:hypothetical protein